MSEFDNTLESNPSYGMSSHESTVSEPTTKVVEPTTVTSATVTEPVVTTTKPSKTKAALEQTKVFLEDHAYEVFLVAGVVVLAAFTLLFPRLALGVGLITGAASGWIAYFSLRKKLEGKTYGV